LIRGEEDFTGKFGNGIRTGRQYDCPEVERRKREEG